MGLDILGQEGIHKKQKKNTKKQVKLDLCALGWPVLHVCSVTLRKTVVYCFGSEVVTGLENYGFRPAV